MGPFMAWATANLVAATLTGLGIEHPENVLSNVFSTGPIAGETDPVSAVTFQIDKAPSLPRNLDNSWRVGRALPLVAPGRGDSCRKGRAAVRQNSGLDKNEVDET